MSNDITKFNPVQAPSMDVKDMQKMTETDSWLKRLQLIATTAELAEPNGPCKPGDFYIIGMKDDTPIHVGPEADITVCGIRFKALKWNSDGAEEELDPESERYAEWKYNADNKINRNNGHSHDYAWGPEFLVWMNDHNQFVQFFCGSPTARRGANEIYALWKNDESSQTLEHKYITSKFKYWAWTARACSTEPATTPTEEELEAVLDAFNKKPEKVEEEQDADR